MDVLNWEAARLEVEKLQFDLLSVENSLKESAEKGLQLLEEKSDLEERYELLENELEKTKTERDVLKQVKSTIGLDAQYLATV